jgi:cytoskeletal protein RodZ
MRFSITTLSLVCFAALMLASSFSQPVSAQFSTTRDLSDLPTATSSTTSKPTSASSDGSSRPTSSSASSDAKKTTSTSKSSSTSSGKATPDGEEGEELANSSADSLTYTAHVVGVAALVLGGAAAAL